MSDATRRNTYWTANDSILMFGLRPASIEMAPSDELSDRKILASLCSTFHQEREIWPEELPSCAGGIVGRLRATQWGPQSCCDYCLSSRHVRGHSGFCPLGKGRLFTEVKGFERLTQTTWHPLKRWIKYPVGCQLSSKYRSGLILTTGMYTTLGLR